MPSEAIRGARELLAVPLDPKLNDATRFSPHWQGVAALTRALIKFERWDDILAPGSIPWGTSLRDRLGRGYAEALAKIEKRDATADIAVASFGDLKKDIEKPENSSYKLQFEVQLLELQGTYALANGDAIKGLMLLTEAAPKELALRAEYDDPPFFPTLMYSKLGYAYLSQNSPKLAADAFERALETVRNDPFALAGLARARQALGDTKAATEALGRALYVWSDPSRDYAGSTRLVRPDSVPRRLTSRPVRSATTAPWASTSSGRRSGSRLPLRRSTLATAPARASRSTD
jgi:tetratricopeptide (TPR) repeat protein